MYQLTNYLFEFCLVFCLLGNKQVSFHGIASFAHSIVRGAERVGVGMPASSLLKQGVN